MENSSVPAAPSAAPRKAAYYDTSAHFLWIGDRTRQIDHAHVEFFRGIANPIGVKVGPSTPLADILDLLRTLNPDREPGKVTLITRYGAGKVRDLLPQHIRAVEDSEYARTVVWQCDPMHGNTLSTPTGIKTRRFSDIYAELQDTLRIHKEQGSHLGGLHLELTGDAVTECLGGSEGLVEDDLSTNYTSFCDPRLNEKQALELAFLVADHLAQEGDA
jgi:3-deoxy-7-phosphoheptulonate synthase